MPSFSRLFVSFWFGLFLTASGLNSALASEDDVPTVNSFFTLDPLVVNLAPPDINRYLQVSVAYEIDSDDVVNHLKSFNPIVRSRMLIVLSTKTVDELLTIEGKQLLMDQLLDLARVSLPPQVEASSIKDVHMTSFVIQ